MKYLITLLLLCLAPMAQSSTITTATVTVTNTTANGNTLVINGATLTFTNAVALPASQIAVGTNIVSSATNIFLARSASRSANLDVYTSSTNVVIFRSYPGQTLTVTLTGAWGTIGLSTNNVGDATMIRAPYAAIGNYERTNSASGIVDYLNGDKSTNLLSATAAAMVNYVNASQVQTITGAKTYTGVNIYSNATQQIVGGVMTNDNTHTANLVVQTGPWSGSYLYPKAYFNFRNPDNSISGFNITVNSAGFIFNGAIQAGAIAVGALTGVGSDNTLTIQTITGDTSILTYGLGNINYVRQTNGVTVGLNATNSFFIGTNTLDGDLSFTRKDNSSLANGSPNPAIDTSTNVYIRVSGPTAAFSINGLTGGRDGRVIFVESDLGYDVTVAYDVGDPTPANRILTRTGASVTVTGSGPIVLRFHYNSALSRWIYDGSN